MVEQREKTASPSGIYRPVRGKKKCLGLGYYKLYMAEDHVLQIYSRFGVEDYQRFYLQDIQAVVAARTHRGTVYSLLLLGLAALAALGIGVWDWSAAVFGPVIALLAAAVIVNVLRGPTCLATITTAVQTERLHSLHRLRNARRFMDALRPAVLRVQTGKRPPASRIAAPRTRAAGPGSAPAERRAP